MNAAITASLSLAIAVLTSNASASTATPVRSSNATSTPAVNIAPFDDEQDWPELSTKTTCWDVFSVRRPHEPLVPLALKDTGKNGQGAVVAHLVLRPDGKSTLLTSRAGTEVRSLEIQGDRKRNRRAVPENGPAQRGDVWDFSWQSAGLRYTFSGVVEQYHIWQRPAFGGLQSLTPADALKADGPFVDETLVVGQLSVCSGAACGAHTVVLSTGCEN